VVGYIPLNFHAETQEQSRDLSTNWRQAPARHPRGQKKYPESAPERAGGK